MDGADGGHRCLDGGLDGDSGLDGDGGLLAGGLGVDDGLGVLLLHRRWPCGFLWGFFGEDDGTGE